jgi:ATP-dependent helicase HrpB
MATEPLPIEARLPALRDALLRATRLVLEAPPGAGKTTRVPLELLQAPWRGDGRIVMLEPRRVAARAAAGFMAEALGEFVGETVGYRIRFESRVGPRTRIEVVTEGILTRMIQDDPALEGVAALVFDEFHERHLSADLGLALALEVQQQLRPELRILLMSATLDGERLARWLDAGELRCEGRCHPVTIQHFAALRDEPLPAQLRRCVRQALAAHPGDLLVFLPGRREIGQVESALAGLVEASGLRVLALHGELPVERQVEVLSADPQGRRRIVLATNVAESSVTLPAVRVVIDAGLAREPRFDPSSGFSRLATVGISQASAEQRAGRAGRVAEGWCYRLWPASQRLEPQRRAEITQVELSGLALELAAWGSAELRFPDPPPPGALAAGRDLLQRLGAMQGDSITDLGRRMLRLGAPPRLAAMLSAAPAEQLGLACDLAALIEARDPLRERRDDLLSRWQALAALRAGSSDPATHRSTLQGIERQAAQWRRRLKAAPAPRATSGHALGALLMHAFPDRIARQHPQDPRRYQLANGRSARLIEDSALYGEPWLVISELRHEHGDALILRATPLDETSLMRDFAEAFSEVEAVRWDGARRAIVAQRERRFERILLEVKPLPAADRTRFAEALIDAVRQLGLDALPWSESLRQLRARIELLRRHCPEIGLPDCGNQALIATLETWLQPALSAKTRLDALSASELDSALRTRLDWKQRQAIDQLAPTRIRVPSGMERSIDYGADGDPVLAVKLQELFGLADTPRIVDGRLPLTLHLLSPAARPLQVTQDLKGFWERIYPEVRREMKGRYPRHPWPEDPWSAPPTHRAKPRSR